MHRFHLPPDACRGDSLTLTDVEAHHALHVLRVRLGDAVAVLDGEGGVFACAVTALDRHRVSLGVRERRTEPRPDHEITLVQAVTKTRSMEWIVQKGTELGLRRLVPVLTARSVPQFSGAEAARKAGRWREIAIESLKQCGTPWLPGIQTPLPLSEYLAGIPRFDLMLVASLHPGASHPRRALEAYRARPGCLPKEIAVWIGPEGDFTEAEVAAICNAGAVPISLGPLVLRAETAAVCCLSFLGYELRA
jgi:16S rRNA (uracil1498-N3)-methyltransferase